MKRLILSAFIMGFICQTMFSQKTDDSWKVYDDHQVARIDITLDPAAVKYLYQNVASDSEFVAKIKFTNKYLDETVDSVGFRLRGNTSRESKKKSFKISFNSYFKGRDFHNLEKLNLNGEHNDPSIIRSKLCFDHFNSAGLIASRASHAEVYINGEYYGLYMSVEHIDENFLKKRFHDDSGNLWKCLYGADLTYKGDDPLLYKKIMNGTTPAYDLSTNQSAGDFSSLVHLIKILNNSSPSDFADSMESVIDVNGVLKYLAMNLLFGSWDSYWNLMNNYYLYNEPETGRFHIIPYDYDNTFGIAWDRNNWSNTNPYTAVKVAGGSRPLAEKLIADPQYRNLYTHFIEYYRDNYFKLTLWESRLDSLQQMITPSATADTYRTLDYGFTTGDFLNSYSAGSYSNQHVKFGLKQYTNLRNSSLSAQLNYVTSRPVIYKIDYSPRYPGAGDSIYVYVSAFSNIGLSNASVKIIKSGESLAATYPLKFSPVKNAKTVEDADRYIGVIPPLGSGKSGIFFVSMTDILGQTQTYPGSGAISIQAGGTTAKTVVINEILADNINSTTDPSGDHDDWVELLNISQAPVLLSGKYLTDSRSLPTKWKFPKDSIYIAPGERLIVWLDEQQNQSGLHANFKLGKSGEFIALTDADGYTVMDSLTFGSQSSDISYGRYPEGSDQWRFMTPSPGKKNIVTGLEKEIIPSDYRLTAYPNPFNPGTVIQYEIPSERFVTIKLFNSLGREIRTLVNETRQAGMHKVKLEAGNLPSGIYLCRIQSGQFVKTIKLQVLK